MDKKIEVKDYYTVYADQIEKIREATRGMDQLSIMNDLLMPTFMKKIDPELDSSWMLNSHDEEGNPVKVEIRNERLKGTCIDQMHEIMKFHKELDWKWWKKADPNNQWFNNEEKRAKLADEIGNELHFTLQKAKLIGMDATDVFMAFLVKHIENMERQERGY